MQDVSSPFLVKNVRLFIAFRLFFTARFYYPVFSIIFLDFGLSVSQFALLNAIWAGVIVVFEVPSGALADVLGRRRLLVATGIMMVVELFLLCMAPVRGGTLLFSLFLVNRILSGLAEASASGADEALAYDALKRAGMESSWGRVLEVQMRLQSLAFVGAMITGGLLYDPQFVGRLAAFAGYGGQITQDLTLRIPLLLTLLFGFFTLGCALAMDEPQFGSEPKATPPLAALAKTMDAGRWILASPFAFSVIVAGLIFDGVMRMVITLGSQYYRVIGIPEAGLGFLGALSAGLGIGVAKLSRHLAEGKAPVFNLGFLSVATLASLVSMSFFPRWWGVVPALVLFAAMGMVSFFVSHYLNAMAPSETRATVLSFKGLAWNISYGVLGMLYALLLWASRKKVGPEFLASSGFNIEDLLFVKTFVAFPLCFALAMGLFMLACLVWRK